jgi:hypothetical protein
MQWNHKAIHIEAVTRERENQATAAVLELAGETTKLGCRQGQFSQLTVL